MSTMNHTRARARRTFWVLLTTTILATGSLTSALARPPGTWTGLTVAASGVVLALAATLTCRVMLALGRPHQHESVSQVATVPREPVPVWVGEVGQVDRGRRQSPHRR
jgi:hypothetical protein